MWCGLRNRWNWLKNMNLGGLIQMGFDRNTRSQKGAECVKSLHDWKGKKKWAPCVREVSDARRPSRKLTDEWLWALRSSGLRSWGLGVDGFKQVKAGSVWLACAADGAPPWEGGGGSSARLRSLCMEPKSYSESMLPRDGFKAMESSFPIEIIEHYSTMAISVLRLQPPMRNYFTYPFIHLPVHLPIHQFIHLANHFPNHCPIHPSNYLFTSLLSGL